MLRMVVLLAASGLCGTLVAPGAPSARCTCVVDRGDSLEWLAHQRSQFREADAVLLVRVTQVATRADRRIVATAAVLRRWKGPAADTTLLALNTYRAWDTVATVTPVRSTCDLWLKPGDEYLVFARTLPDGLLYSTKCSGSVPRADAAAILPALDSAVAPEA